MSIAEATEAAGKIWSVSKLNALTCPLISCELWQQIMGPTERAPYMQQAQMQASKQIAARKFTSQGVPIDQVEKVEEQKKQFEIKMLEDVKRSVHLASKFFLLMYF